MKILSVCKIGFLVITIFLISCKENKKKTNDNSSKNKSKTIVSTPEEVNSAKEFITDNVDAYPRDIGVFKNKAVAHRLEDILGDEYGKMINNFETQTPVVTENGIYKFTGCKAHNCPAYHATVLYDAKKDNFNVLIEQKGKVKVYDEKGKISMTKSLRYK